MSNEIVLLISLISIFGIVLISFYLFGEYGLVCWTVIATIAANIEVLILVNAFGMVQTLGNILFASTFLVTDIISEIYGKKSANRAVYVGIFTSICFIIISQSWFLYTPDISDVALGNVRAIFANTPRMMISGLVVYSIVQKLDVVLYHYIWKKTEELSGSKKKFLWLRNNVSTLTSQLINTVLFSVLAFWNKYNSSTIISIIISSYIIFMFTSLLDTPFVYFARYIYEKKKLKEI